jgi:hypothetical protein
MIDDATAGCWRCGMTQPGAFNHGDAKTLRKKTQKTNTRKRQAATRSQVAARFL